MPHSRARPVPSPGHARISTSTRRRRSARSSTVTSRRSSSTPRPGRMLTAVRATPNWRCAGTARPSTSLPRPPQRAASTSSRSARTRSSTAGARMTAAIDQTTLRHRPTRTARRSSPGRRRRRPPTGIVARISRIVRTSWLFGPPGSDFPTKILAAAAAARAERQPLQVVADEFGSPTFTHDVAEAVAAMLGADVRRGVQHVVNAGVASRADWARELFRQAGVDVTIEAMSLSDWPRPSTPPAWGVLEPTEIPGVEPLRPWQQALADYFRCSGGSGPPRPPDEHRPRRPPRYRASGTGRSSASPTSAGPFVRSGARVP